MKMLTTCNDCGEHIVVNYEPEDRAIDPDSCPFCRGVTLVPLVPCLACMNLVPSTEICDGLCLACHADIE